MSANVLIRREWGLIAVSRHQSAFVFAVKGLPIAKVGNLRIIGEWIPYRTYDGLDFVLVRTVGLRSAGSRGET
jgi:hypothetical protein